MPENVKIFEKIPATQIQQPTKNIQLYTKWNLSQECKTGSIYKKINIIHTLKMKREKKIFLIKNKNEEGMELHQNKKILYSEGNHQRNDKATY